MDLDPACHFDTNQDPDRAFQFDTDPDLCRVKEVIYLKQYFLYILTLFFVSRSSRTQPKAYFLFSLPVNFVVLIRVAYGSRYWKIIRIRIHNTGVRDSYHCITPWNGLKYHYPGGGGFSGKDCF
jgi:hypothetical protein